MTSCRWAYGRSGFRSALSGRWGTLGDFGACGGEDPGLDLLERQGEFDARCPPVASPTEHGSQLGGIYLVAAADADLGQARAHLLEEDGQLLVAHRVELVDGTVGLIRRRAAGGQLGLCDRPPDQAVLALEMQAFQDLSLHPRGGGRPAG